MLKIFFFFFITQISFLAYGQEGTDNTISTQTEFTEVVKKEVEEKVHPLIQIQQLGYPEINFKALNDGRVQNILDKALREGLIANIPADVIHKTIMEKVNGTLVEDLLKKAPKVLDKVIDILRDKEALPELLKILTKKDDLKVYLTYWIIILIITIWLKKTLLSKKARWNFIQRFLVGMTINLLNISASIYAFYSIFEKELNPTLKIIGLI